MAKKAPARQDEQTALLRKILVELRRLNANLERKGSAPVPQGVGDDGDLDEDSEELEYFE